MPAIERQPLPAHALLQRHARSGGYADCFATTVARRVSLAAFVEAFYTTRVFRLERAILRVAVARPSSDAEAAQLARGARETFSAWAVEARADDQLLMCDLHGRTRSWFMVQPLDARSTRLLFGSAVVGRARDDGTSRMGAGFRLLLGFHVVYSRVLLAAARRRLDAV